MHARYNASLSFPLHNPQPYATLQGSQTLLPKATTLSLRTSSVTMPIDYSRFDKIDTSDDEDALLDRRRRTAV